VKIFLDSVGCRLNEAEIERFASQLIESGHQLVPDATNADIAIINTCNVTSEAASDSRQVIRQVDRAGAKTIVLTGCLVSLDANTSLYTKKKAIVIPNAEKDRLVRLLGERWNFIPSPDVHLHAFLPGKRKRTRAFIKAQDGCDQHCTYCITRLARGKAHSMHLKQIIQDIQAAEMSGVKEAVLCGVQLGAWGIDLTPPSKISRLVQEVLTQTSIPRLRLSSIEPWGLDEEFYRLWENGRLCRQLHLPMQSGSDRLLRLMGRKNSTSGYREIVAVVRGISPGIAITTDVLVGFPGETEEDCSLTEGFLRDLKFAGGHVFTYSSRPGTAAAKMEGHIPMKVRKDRNYKIRSLFTKLKEDYFRVFIGKELPVLWERAEEQTGGHWCLEGWSDNYIRVRMKAKRNLYNQISFVEIKKVEGEIAWGEEVRDAGNGG
jgi:threonylcarbamoyladenosine tRNA methylthiotransferase MtaB